MYFLIITAIYSLIIQRVQEKKEITVSEGHTQLKSLFSGYIYFGYLNHYFKLLLAI